MARTGVHRLAHPQRVRIPQSPAGIFPDRCAVRCVVLIALENLYAARLAKTTTSGQRMPDEQKKMGFSPPEPFWVGGPV